MEKEPDNNVNEINLSEAKEYLVNISNQAGEILKKYFSSGNYSLKQKEGVDFTTKADEEVDKFLIEKITKKYSQSNFLTEETAPKDYSSLKDKKNLWVIDPLDGTINFSRKHPNFAISIALVDKGQTKLGVINAPLKEEIYWAQKDKEGAFLNNESIKVSETDSLRETTVACDWAWDLEKRKNVVGWIGKLISSVRQIKSMGSAVADMASLAKGQIDVYMHSGLKPWDMAAASIIIEKAGGKITTPKGEKWNVFNPDILATNNILHQQIIEKIN
jgi:myo-inositol-1(or 4)-monophosphatase